MADTYEVYTPEEIRKKAFKEAGIHTASYPKPSLGDTLKRKAVGAVQGGFKRLGEYEAGRAKKQAEFDATYAKAYGRARNVQIRKLARTKARAEFAATGTDLGMGAGLGFGSSEDSSVIGFDLGNARSVAHRQTIVGRHSLTRNRARYRPTKRRRAEARRGSMGIDLTGII